MQLPSPKPAPATISSCRTLFVENLTPSQRATITPKLKPKADSVSGFLAGHEDLLESATKKNAALAKLGITHEALAERITDVANQALKLPNVTVRKMVYRGPQACPFTALGTQCPTTSVDYNFVETTSGKVVRVSGLMPHLIADHHFLEGDVEYGIDPESIASLLQISVPTVEGTQIAPKHGSRS